jgi:hypothetical protein
MSSQSALSSVQCRITERRSAVREQWHFYEITSAQRTDCNITDAARELAQNIDNPYITLKIKQKTKWD